MAEAFSYDTEVLLEAADRAIARSREIIEQRHRLLAECSRANHEQELRFVFRRQLAEQK